MRAWKYGPLRCQNSKINANYLVLQNSVSQCINSLTSKVVNNTSEIRLVKINALYKFILLMFGYDFK